MEEDQIWGYYTNSYDKWWWLRSVLKCGYGGKWTESKSILEIEPIRFCDRLNDVEHEKKSKMTPKFLPWTTRSIELLLMNTRKHAGGIDLEKEIKSSDWT